MEIKDLYIEYCFERSIENVSEGEIVEEIYNDGFKTKCVVSNMTYDCYYDLDFLHHRDDGPALISSNGLYKEYYKHGKAHRLDGPALYNDHYINGELISENEFKRISKILLENSLMDYQNGKLYWK